MKTLIVILLAAGVACASTFFVVSTRNAAQMKQAQAAWNAEKLQLQASMTNTSAPAEKIAVVAAPSVSAPAGESPQDILNDLLNIKLGTGSERNMALRLVVFKLETLTQLGKPAIPAIRAFIGRNVDVDYGTQDDNNGGNNANNNAAAGGNNNSGVNAATTATTDATAGNNNTPGNNRRARRGGGNNGGGFGGFAGGFGNFRVTRRARNIENLRTDWVAPPSLRLGLVGALKEIGGAESEQALAEMLSSTARGVEVAYLTVVLEEIAPGKYRDTAVAAAKELLMNPPAVDSPDQLDNLSKSYLYGVLEFYKDTSFAVNAEQMLVGADGRLDQDAMDYLSTVLKDQSVSALYAAYQNSNLTNQFDKLNLQRQIMGYVGQNSQANQLFTDTLNNPDVDSRVKAFTVAQLAGGGFGPFATDAPDPQVAGPRIAILNSLLANSTYANDPVLSQVIPATIDAIEKGDSVDPQVLRGIGGGRGFGGRGGGNGNGGGGNAGGNNGGNQ